MNLSFAVITCSDSRDIASDEAGKALLGLIKERGWVCKSHSVVSDEQEAIERELIRACDEERVGIVLTCGGTGLSVRDVTPEATIAVCDRAVPGIAEAIRAKSLQITERAMLSRATSGLRSMTLIINLPGSTKAARESFGFAEDQLEHAIKMLHGGRH